MTFGNIITLIGEITELFLTAIERMMLRLNECVL